MPKLHGVWPGNNRFSCGCCISGPSREVGGIIYIQFCILAIVIPFSIFIVADNWKITPALPLVFFLCLIATQLFLLLTACSDPGIIPRRPFLEVQPEKNKLFLEPRDETKFCETCQIYRPPRASHCSACQNCVQVFDHHCGVVGNCIGKRNYRFFVLFLGSSVLSMVMVVVNMAVFFVKRSEQDVNQTVVIIIVSVIAGTITIPLFCFFAFHLFLALTGNTTRQYLKEIQNLPSKPQNQWCDVDDPLFNPFEQIDERTALQIEEKIKRMRQPMEMRPSAIYTSSNKEMR